MDQAASIPTGTEIALSTKKTTKLDYRSCSKIRDGKQNNAALRRTGNSG
jgi:hypothetical protein